MALSPSLDSTQSTSKHSINASQLAAASGHRSPVLDSGDYIQSAPLRARTDPSYIPTPSRYHIPSLIRFCTLNILISAYYRSTAQRSYTAYLQGFRTLGIYMISVSTSEVCWNCFTTRSTRLAGVFIYYYLVFSICCGARRAQFCFLGSVFYGFYPSTRACTHCAVFAAGIWFWSGDSLSF